MTVSKRKRQARKKANRELRVAAYAALLLAGEPPQNSKRYAFHTSDLRLLRAMLNGGLA